MADDGMVLNFSVGEGSLGTKLVFKGGRWKDRLRAKKSLQRRKDSNRRGETLTGSNVVPTKAQESVVLTKVLESVSVEEVARPSKRQRLNGDQHSHPRSNNTTAKPKEVVSSLFTYNPKAKTSIAAQTQTEDASVPEPSNAPLPASASPFTSLGLSPFLSTHLTQSLSLSAPTAIQKAAITQLLKEDSDAFIQAETGSGKTLAYLLPILQRILALSEPSSESPVDGEIKARRLDRTSGLLALILAPTRELTHQISAVLVRLLRPLPWLVAGTVTGGATKNHEKSRLRKGINILVATPGRLADHLENTEVLDVSNVRWLVLDEGDRLVELGFEEEIKRIVQKLEERQGKKRPGTVQVIGLPEKRTTVLCSATMKMGVQKLGEISLKDAVHIKVDAEASMPSIKGQDGVTKTGQETETSFLAPAQLKQSYIVVPPKQRLVTLAALLKRTFARKGSVMKAIVFLSCADSVDFHFDVFARKEAQPPNEATASNQKSNSNERNRKIENQDTSPPEATASNQKSNSNERNRKIENQDTSPPEPNSENRKPNLPTISSTPTLSSTTNPSLTLHKLHGSLDQKLRTATLQSFTRSPDPSILLSTDVASRGLDLPNIDLVIEYDPPFSAPDHLHRVGRTARAGNQGRACCFLMPGPEEAYIPILQACAPASIKGQDATTVLKNAFAHQPPHTTSKHNTPIATVHEPSWDAQATAWQLDVERWILTDARAAALARKAFISHVRAYATHVVAERRVFDVKALHLGHLAKAFGLRERPGQMGRAGDGDGAAKRRAGEGGGAVGKMRRKMREQAEGVAGEFNIG